MDKQWLNNQINMMLAKKYSQPMTPQERVKGGASALPVIGDAISGYDAYQSAKQGDYMGAALNAVGMLPLVPGLAGIMKPVSKSDELLATIKTTIPSLPGDSGFMRQDVKPVTEWFSDLLNKNNVPHETIFSGSSYGPSTYTKIHGLNDEVRISNHSKGAFNNQFYNSPVTPEEFHNIIMNAGKSVKRSPSEIDEILKNQDLQRVKELYPRLIKSADKKLSRGKGISNSEKMAIDLRNSGYENP